MGTGFLCDRAAVTGKTIKTLHMTFPKKRNLNDDKHYDVITYKCHVERISIKYEPIENVAIIIIVMTRR